MLYRILTYALKVIDWGALYSLNIYRGSPLSTIFGNWKKKYYAKFVLVCTTQSISTCTVFSTYKFHQYGFQYIALENRTSENRTTGNRTSREPPVERIHLVTSLACWYVSMTVGPALHKICRPCNNASMLKIRTHGLTTNDKQQSFDSLIL